jgi:hypothetical protein
VWVAPPPDGGGREAWLSMLDGGEPNWAMHSVTRSYQYPVYKMDESKQRTLHAVVVAAVPVA